MDALRSGASQPTQEQPGHRVDLPDAMRSKLEHAFCADLSAVRLCESQAVTEEGHAVITEFMPGELAEDYGLPVVYTAVLMKLGDRKAELADRLPDRNMICPLGHYGIFEEEQQVYHKYSVPFPAGITPEKPADQALDLLSLSFELLAEKYPELAEYAAEEKDPEA